MDYGSGNQNLHEYHLQIKPKQIGWCDFYHLFTAAPLSQLWWCVLRQMFTKQSAHSCVAFYYTRACVWHMPWSIDKFTINREGGCCVQTTGTTLVVNCNFGRGQQPNMIHIHLFKESNSPKSTAVHSLSHHLKRSRVAHFWGWEGYRSSNQLSP